jgi:hypothetical protein
LPFSALFEYSAKTADFNFSSRWGFSSNFDDEILNSFDISVPLSFSMPRLSLPKYGSLDF